MTRSGAPVALVTGAGSGIGRAIALALASAGWELALAGRRAAPLEETAGRVARAGGRAAAMPCDVTMETGVAGLMEELGGRFGRLDALVHSSGYGRFDSLEETSLAEWERTLAANLTAVFLVTRAALPLLERGLHPVVVAMSSVAARNVFPNSAAYTASKCGLEGLVGVMRQELRGRGIRVLSVIAGATATPFWERQSGSWDAARMMPAEEVARLVVSAMTADPRAAVEEILVRPAGGDL